jgi:hypothetical protein
MSTLRLQQVKTDFARKTKKTPNEGRFGLVVLNAPSNQEKAADKPALHFNNQTGQADLL